MDGETQKPFACKAKGCGMSFTNDDHLSVHEKKHEMILNLGITSKAASAFVADQTPTPTRLIKNCEDVGLFDDLKHVNPFDETFRRAVESKSSTPRIEVSSVSQTLPENLLLSEESLHTPQVFATFDGTTSTPASGESYDEFKVEKQKLILPEKIACKHKKLSKKSKPIRKIQSHVSKPSTIFPSPQVKQILVPATINLLPSTQIIAFSIPGTAIVQTSRPLILPKAAAPAESKLQQPEISIKDKLKALLNSSKEPATDKIPSSNTPSTKRTHTAKFLNKSSPKEIYDDCMERRRMAAMRYRWKVKKEQCDLKRKNAELAAENNQLKALVKQLKEVLWSHQNCNVSNGQQNGTVAAPIFTLKTPQPMQLSTMKFIVHNACSPVTNVKIPVSSADQLRSETND